MPWEREALGIALVTPHPRDREIKWSAVSMAAVSDGSEYYDADSIREMQSWLEQCLGFLQDSTKLPRPLDLPDIPVGKLDEIRAHANESCLKRFIVATKGDVGKARGKLSRALEWRAKRVYKGMTCANCAQDVTSHCLKLLGLDKRGRPVVYGNSPRATNLTTKESVDHVIHNLETGFQLPGAADQFVFLVDFNGFGFKDCMNPSLGSTIISTFSEYYPERLGEVILLDAPTVFGMLYGALKPFIDPRTAAKISWVSGKESVLKRIDDLLPAPSARWVHEAMELPPLPGRLPDWTPADWPPQPEEPLQLGGSKADGGALAGQDKATKAARGTGGRSSIDGTAAAEAGAAGAGVAEGGVAARDESIISEGKAAGGAAAGGGGGGVSAAEVEVGSSTGVEDGSSTGVGPADPS